MAIVEGVFLGCMIFMCGLLGAINIKLSLILKAIEGRNKHDKLEYDRRTMIAAMTGRL